MAKEKDIHRLQLLLDASKIERCIWCGTQQSDTWFDSPEGFYCSSDCMKASRTQNQRFWQAMCVLLFVSSVLIYLATGPFFSFDRRLETVAFGISITLYLIMLYLAISQYRKYESAVPKNSRRGVRPTGVSLLRKISEPVECPKCGAKIDLANIGDDLIYHCQYCGANGVVEIEIIQ